MFTALKYLLSVALPSDYRGDAQLQSQLHHSLVTYMAHLTSIGRVVLCSERNLGELSADRFLIQR
jgi:hypothetical protein